MRRTTTPTAAGLIGLVLCAPTSASSAPPAAIASCAGFPATIVGTGPTVTGTEGRDVIVSSTATSVDALGGDDTICLTTPRAAGAMHVDAGPGDDEVLLPVADLASGSTLAGGAGRDLLVAGHADHPLTLDLKLSRFAAGPEVWAATAFEDGFLMAPEVVLVGDMWDNDLRFHGCQAVVRGGNGDDDMVAVGGDPYFDDYSFGCDASATMWGGPGADLLRGGHGPDLLEGEGHRDRVQGLGGDDVVRGGQGHDVLIGGAGFDRVDGSRGRDRCTADRERRCER